MTRGLALLCLAARVAQAEPAPRVVVAAADPELLREVASALAPWHVEVVVGARDDDRARIVIWRDGGELVVEDRASGTVQRHAAQPNDPVAGAATALTVKTLLSLDAPPPPPPAPTPTPSLRALVVGGAALSGTSVARGSLVALIAPWDGALRVGIAGMLTSDPAINSAGFKGTWGLWGLAAAASYAFAWDAWEVAPTVELGFARSVLHGTEDMTARDELATLPRFAVGAIGARRFGRFAVGLEVAFAATPGGDTYTKTMGMAEIFTPPSSSVELGLVVSCDLFGAAGH